MMKDLWNRFVENLIFPKGYSKIYNVLFILMCIILVYVFVYTTGGTKYVYSHTMYIPIILATISSGVKGGVIVGFIAGILLGPLMPLDTTTKESQDFFNWSYRLIVFLFVGFISGLAFNEFRKKTKQIFSLVTHNQETDIPSINILNSNSLYGGKLNFSKIKYLISVVINNHDNIIDLFNRKHYIKLVKSLYQKINNMLPNDSRIFQSETNRFWLCISTDDIDDFVNNIIKSFNENFYINNIPIYVELTIGIAKYQHKDLLK